MPTMFIDLQDGFAGDTVVISIDGQEVFRQEGVRTRRTLGYAESLQTLVGSRPVNLEVSITTTGLSGTGIVDAAQTPYVGISVVKNQVHLVPSRAPFGYA